MGTTVCHTVSLTLPHTVQNRVLGLLSASVLGVIPPVINMSHTSSTDANTHQTQTEILAITATMTNVPDSLGMLIVLVWRNMSDPSQGIAQQIFIGVDGIYVRTAPYGSIGSLVYAAWKKAPLENM